MSKILAFPLRAASLALTGSLVVLKGTSSTDCANSTSGAIALGELSRGRVHCTYTRDGSSSTGRAIFAVDVSLDAPATDAASVSNWVPVQLADASSFSSGSITDYALQVSTAPSVTGATAQGTPPIDLSGAWWVRVRVADVDGTHPGTITATILGGDA